MRPSIRSRKLAGVTRHLSGNIYLPLRSSSSFHGLTSSNRVRSKSQNLFRVSGRTHFQDGLAQVMYSTRVAGRPSEAHLGTNIHEELPRRAFTCGSAGPDPNLTG